MSANSEPSKPITPSPNPISTPTKTETGASTSVETGGGAYIAQGVQINNGVFIGRDKIVNLGEQQYDVRGLVTGGADGTARLWDLSATDIAASVRVLRGHEDLISTVVISADSRWLVTGGYYGTVRLWYVRPDELIEFACRAAARNLSLFEWQSYLLPETYRKTCPNFPDGEGVLVVEPSAPPP